MTKKRVLKVYADDAGRHQCVDRTRTYCYYQCMLEVHGEDYGAVTADCACDIGDPVPTQPPSLDGSTLDPLCYRLGL